MEKIRIKNSDLYVTRLCFGGCPMGGHGWGHVSKQSVINSIKKAFQIGINFFDTADTYGLGEGEKILGQALNKNINDVIIATKFGVRIINGETIYDNSPTWIRTALENSLKRLGRDYIDIYQLHYRDKKTSMDEIIKTLEELKKEKKIKYYGFSNIYISDIEELKKHKGKFITFQNEFSLASRHNENDIVRIIKELEINLMSWGSLGQGILTGKYDKDVKFNENDRRSRKEYTNFHGNKLIHNLAIVNKLKILSIKYNKPISSIAIRWILDYIPNSVVIAGIKNIKQLEMNASSLDWNLKKEDIKLLEKISYYEGEKNDK